MMLQRFIEENTGKLINVDGVPGNEGQSPQLVAAWCRFLGLPYQWANAFDWWDDSDETFAEHWDKMVRSPDEYPRPGDIIVFSSQLPGSEGCGHLSIFVDGKPGASAWTGFDANWGGKSAHIQSHNWSYVMGWFTPVNRSVLEAPIPTPIAIPTAAEPFELETHEAKIVVVKEHGATLYNLNDVAWDSFNINVLGALPAGEEIAVVATAQHRLGGRYYMTDTDLPQGYDVNDCRDYDESGGDPEFDQEPKPGFHISAPITAPNSTDTVQLLRKMPKYQTVSDAREGRNALGELMPARYYVYKRLPSGFLNITAELGMPGRWINPADLIERDWHQLTEWFDEPRYFAATEEAPILDLDGNGDPLRILYRQPILIVGMFVGPDHQTYAAPEPTFSQGQWYGILPKYLRPIRVPEQSPTPVAVTEELPEYLQPPKLPLHVRMLLAIQNSEVLKTLKRKT